MMAIEKFNNVLLTLATGAALQSDSTHLNADKTELLWFGPASELSSYSLAITLYENVIKPFTVVRDLCSNAPARHGLTRSHANRDLILPITGWDLE